MEKSFYLNLINKNNKVFIISKDNCPLCVKAKELYETIEVEYKVYNCEDTTNDNKENIIDFKEEMKEHTGGKMFPFCYINSKYIGGYKQLENLLITGKLKELLNEIGIDYEEDF